jgi:putative peptidoglycan binding protein
MTLDMPDSIYPANLPPGYPAYLGYADGLWPSAPELRKRFPAAHIIALTVTGGTLNADGIDCEPGNPNAVSSADWMARKIAAAPGTRPVIYASVIGTPGYGMPDVLRELAARGIMPASVRLLSAHYASRHICGPATCGLISTPMDGTQWTDTFSGAGGSLIDMSEVLDSFFSIPPPAPPPTGWLEPIMNDLPTLAQGSTGNDVRTAQGLLVARGHPAEPGTPGLGVDGVFGPATDQVVRSVQAGWGLTVDGIVGPKTWAKLLNR